MRLICWGEVLPTVELLLRKNFCWGKTELRDLCWVNIDEKDFDEKSLSRKNCIERSLLGEHLMKRTLMRKVLLRKTVLRDLLLRGHLMKQLLFRKGDGQNGSIWQNYFGSFRNWARLVLNYSFLQGQYLIGVSLRTIAGRGWGRSVALRWPSLSRVLSGSFAFHLTTTRRSGISTHLCTGVSGRDMV